MANGFNWIMIWLFGVRTELVIVGVRIPKGDGVGLPTVGIGTLTNHSGGLPIITEDGIMMITMAGFGYPIMIGDSSWVEWRYDDDYIGWAPLPPYASFHIDLGIHFSIRWHSHHNYWNFVRYNRFYDRRVYNYYLDDRHCERIFERTKYRTNYYSDRDRIINGGIDRSFIERKGGYRISERNITSVDNYRDFERSREVRSDRVIAYRPSDREVENGRTIDKFDIKRGENRSTLEREKIRTPLTVDDGRTISSDRPREREREINVGMDTRRDEGRIREESKETNLPINLKEMLNEIVFASRVKIGEWKKLNATVLKGEKMKL